MKGVLLVEVPSVLSALKYAALNSVSVWPQETLAVSSQGSLRLREESMGTAVRGLD
jgi:hypothetical protein